LEDFVFATTLGMTLFLFITEQLERNKTQSTLGKVSNQKPTKKKHLGKK
jgi:hypothetical protein